ncbi:Metallo-peptidase family M12-domain-containing protein [Parasitella parasitica]|nr:Metallo-peptidase family M12-domain-containing protein [Parasitella parasitica]
MYSTILCILLLLFTQVKGMSTRPSKLSKIETIDNPIITFNHNSFYDSKRNLNSDSQTIQYHDQFSLDFTAFDKSISLSLSPNVDLFHPDAQLTVFNTDGSLHAVEKVVPHEYLVFKGHVNVKEHQWARILMRKDLEHTSPIFEGAFTMDSDIYHIKTTPNYHLTKRSDDPVSTNRYAKMIIYRDSDQLIEDEQEESGLLEKRYRHKDDIMCAMEELAYNRRMTGSHAAPTTVNATNTTSESNAFSNLWEKRDMDVFSTSLVPTSSPSPPVIQGCPTARKIAYMGAAADCSYVLSYGSVRYAKLQMINDWNVASAVYEKTFNVSLGLIYLQISVPECPTKPKSNLAWNQACSSYYSINDRLSDFSLWRGTKGDDGAALWHLMTKCATGVKVGIAWLSQLCETQVSQQIEDDGSYEWVSGTGVSSITRDEWKVVAHEVGHGFGAIHDCTSKMCPCKGECGCCPLSDTVCSAGDTYLMNPTSNVSTNDFSPCSVSDICNTFPNIGYCLKSPDLRTGGTFSLCGNGILEPGEECDSGLTDSDCCYARTCKLKPNAICDDYSNQCCLNCTIAPKDTICRPAVSECDTTEYCTGESSQCPADFFDADGLDCANGTMKCASGICTSRDQQCMSRGLRQNISEQCSFQKDSCLISCTDPKDSRNCLMLSGMFLDGTECGLAGFCQKGTCVGTGALNTLKAWTAQNKAIAIPVYIFGSIGVLLIIGWIVWFIRRRYKRKILLSEKDKDSRPNSIISFPPLTTLKSPTTANTAAAPGHAMKRDSQIVPFPNSIPSSLLQHQSHNTNNATEIELENLTIPTNNNTNSNNLVNTPSNGNNAQTSSRRNTLYSTPNINTDVADHRSITVGTHRRGKSNIE